MSDSHIDVLVIGAGLSGLGTACQATREFPEKTINGVERRAARPIGPKRWTGVSVLRGLVNTALDRRTERNVTIQSILRDADVAPGAGRGNPMTGLVYMIAFMLIPIWIPLVAVGIGFVRDRVRSGGHTSLRFDHLGPASRPAAQAATDLGLRSPQAPPHVSTPSQEVISA
jgi:hypothetical protein